MKIAFATPSYRRPKCLTARYLPFTKIYVDGSDYDEYIEANKGFGEVVRCADGIQGNLPRVRNYILDCEFGNGADVVVMMDDDVNRLGVYEPDGKKYGFVRKTITAEDMPKFVEYGTRLCREWGFGMWSVNYNEDHLLYRHFQPFSTTQAAVGQFMVFVEDGLRFDESLPLKEDYDMALQQMNKYRGVLKLNFAHVNADFGKLVGGTSVRRNFDREHEQFLLFREKWGSDIVVGVNKKSGKGRSTKNEPLIEKYDFSHPMVKVPIKGI